MRSSLLAALFPATLLAAGLDAIEAPGGGDLRVERKSAGIEWGGPLPIQGDS